MKIKKALVMAAGLGSRFLPVTKVIQKEMIPVLNYPTIYYQVEDYVKAGVEEIVIVVNERNTQIRDFFTENKVLYKFLKDRGRLDIYEPLERLHKMAEFTFVLQKDSDPYGTAVPVMLSEQYLKEEDYFGVSTSDEFILNKDGSSELANMMDFLAKTGRTALMSALERSEEDLHKYGILKTSEEKGVRLVEDIVEKPEPGKAPSNLSNTSKYIFPNEVFDVLKTQSLNARHSEYLITDTVIELSRRIGVVVYVPGGEYLDTGNPALWLKANIFMAAMDEDVKNDLKDFVDGL